MATEDDETPDRPPIQTYEQVIALVQRSRVIITLSPPDAPGLPWNVHILKSDLHGETPSLAELSEALENFIKEIDE